MLNTTYDVRASRHTLLESAELARVEPRGYRVLQPRRRAPEGRRSARKCIASRLGRREELNANIGDLATFDAEVKRDSRGRARSGRLARPTTVANGPIWPQDLSMDDVAHRAISALPGGLEVKQGRDRYLAENGFTVAAYDAKWTPASVFGINIAVPNTPNHQRALRWHDLHHVATGYGTDLAGEAEVSAWELRRGLKGLDLYVRAIVISVALLGAVVAPRRTWRAWVAAGRAGENLFARELGKYDATLAMDIATLRAQLGIPPDGLATERGLHSAAPKP
jgi:hypothetical protein